MLKKYLGLSLLLIILMTSCGRQDMKSAKTTFRDDLTFLKQHTDVVVLHDSTHQALVAVLPKLQGRVMTSSAAGEDGLSFGWVNRELIASGQFQQHINVFGGEDRFWIGPEGGQFSVFFKNGVEFNLENWFTPAPVDTEPWELVSSAADFAILKKEMVLENYAGTQFKLLVDRTISLLTQAEATELLQINISPEMKMVAYESNNQITNTGEKAWEKNTGLLSIWILGMFNPSPATTIVIPFLQGDEAELGPIVNDAYFGKVPTERLVVKASPSTGSGNVLFFSGDGQYRSKIGLTPYRAKSILGSYDAENQALTIVQYNKPEGNPPDYVNSMWEMQKEPFKGDVVNSYNDGPPEPGKKPMGPFYELETSSKAAALAPGEALTHIHRTYHFQGPVAELDKIAQCLLEVSIQEITNAFQK